MNIFEFAMEKEKLAESCYRQLASKVSNKRMKNTFTMFADEEARHYEVISKMKENVPVELLQTTVIADANSLLVQIKEQKDCSFDVNEQQLYEKARDMEQENMQFYLQKADQVEEPNQKEIFRKLAADEKEHYLLLDSIIKFAFQLEP